MKKNKKFTIIVVSDATSRNKEFSVSSRLINNLLISFSVLLLFFGFILFHYLTISLDKQKMKRLEVENSSKQKKIDELAKTIDNLNEHLKKMEIYKERIMIAAGLTSPLALTEVGQGGPENFQPGMENQAAQSFSPQKELKTEVSSGNVLTKAGEIQNKAKKIEETLKFIEDTIDKQKLRLAATPAIWPTRGLITASFGYRIHPFTGKSDFHNGIDIATQLGNKVIAPADGIVILTAYQDFYGNLIIIDHGFGYTTRYGHLAKFAVKEGQKIKRGDIIGYVGNSGRSTAPHLHYEVRFMDQPLPPNKFILD